MLGRPPGDPLAALGGRALSPAARPDRRSSTATRSTGPCPPAPSSARSARISRRHPGARLPASRPRAAARRLRRDDAPAQGRVRRGDAGDLADRLRPPARIASTASRCSTPSGPPRRCAARRSRSSGAATPNAGAGPMTARRRHHGRGGDVRPARRRSRAASPRSPRHALRRRGHRRRPGAVRAGARRRARACAGLHGRYVEQPRLGLSASRNLALARATAHRCSRSPTTTARRPPAGSPRSRPRSRARPSRRRSPARSLPLGPRPPDGHAVSLRASATASRRARRGCCRGTSAAARTSPRRARCCSRRAAGTSASASARPARPRRTPTCCTGSCAAAGLVRYEPQAVDPPRVADVGAAAADALVLRPRRRRPVRPAAAPRDPLRAADARSPTRACTPARSPRRRAGATAARATEHARALRGLAARAALRPARLRRRAERGRRDAQPLPRDGPDLLARAARHARGDGRVGARRRRASRASCSSSTRARSATPSSRGSAPCAAATCATCTRAATGLSRARNIGLRAAASDVVVLIDDDMFVEPDWLERLVGAMPRRRSARRRSPAACWPRRPRAPAARCPPAALVTRATPGGLPRPPADRRRAGRERRAAPRDRARARRLRRAPRRGHALRLRRRQRHRPAAARRRLRGAPRAGGGRPASRLAHGAAARCACAGTTAAARARSTSST